jgi:hypothetical protein
MYIKISSSRDDDMSSTREDVIRPRYVQTRVWITNEARLRLLSHVLMLVSTQLVCGLPYKCSFVDKDSEWFSWYAAGDPFPTGINYFSLLHSF